MNAAAIQNPEAEAVPLKTRILSQLREFIVSRKSIVAFALFAVIAGVMTFGLYANNRNLNLQRMKDKVLAIASTGALQFDAKDIDAVWKPEDVNKPEYANLVATLNRIRRSNTDIQFVYLMRKTNDPMKMAFIADADAIYTNQKKDLNHDGVFNEADEISYPGQLYDDDEYPQINTALDTALVGIGTDQWGTFVSSQAPIRDENGNAVAVIGVDMFASKLDDLSANTFTPVFVFGGLFALFIFIRFGAINRSILREALGLILSNKKKFFLWIFLLILIIVGSTFLFSRINKKLELVKMGEKLMAIAVTAADDFNPNDLEKLHWARDMKTSEYQKIYHQLNEIRDKNPEITYAYITRPTENKDLFEFVADADSNYNLPFYSKLFSDFSPIGESDENVAPGVIYDDSRGHLLLKALQRPHYGQTSFDQWGYALSGFAPIFDRSGHAIAVLGLDIE
jgi:hypothetical protein